MAVHAGLATPLAPQGHRPLTQVVVEGLPRMNAERRPVTILINPAARQRVPMNGDALAALTLYRTVAAELADVVLPAVLILLM